MNYKGSYSGSTNYSIGDVVVFTDGVAYEKFEAAPTGTTPHNTRAWRRVNQPLQEVVIMMHNMITTMNSSISSQATTDSNLSKMIAPEYSKKTYAEHDLVTRSGKLYYAKAAISPADSSWTAAHWQETTVGAEITALQPEE